MKNYGKELILDLHGCDIITFNKNSINRFFIELCDLIKMERVQSHWWEDHEATEKHLQGISAIQFIKTSNITIHTITLMSNVYLNIFSCSDFDPKEAEKFSKNFFKSDICYSTVIERK